MHIVGRGNDQRKDLKKFQKKLKKGIDKSF